MTTPTDADVPRQTTPTDADGPRHRFFQRIEEAVRAGHVQCFLHGENVAGDWFFNGPLGRVRDLRESLAFQILHTQFRSWPRVATIRKTELRLYERDPDRLGGMTWRSLRNANDLEDALLGRSAPAASGGILGAAVEQRRRESAAQEDDRGHEGSPAVVNIEVFSRITRLMRSAPEPFAVVVEGLQWLAELFPGRQHALEWIEELDRWPGAGLEGRHLSVIVLSALEALEPYLGIRDRDLHAVYVGGPSVAELTATLERVRDSHGASGVLPVLTRPHWQRLASALKNKGFSLLNAAHKFHGFLEHWEATPPQERDADALVSRFVKELDPAIEEVLWEEVFLPEITRRQIDHLFETFLNPGTERPPKGLLLWGPPGTGKTHIARALANRGGFYFQPLKLADLKGRFVGESGKNVQRLFAEARASSPTLMFIDEVDTIFGLRGGHNQDSFANDLVNQFLAETDGVDTTRQRILIVATTNRPDLVDPAIKSRLPPLEIGLPDEGNRRQMLRQRLAVVRPPLSEPQFEVLIAASAGLSGRDLDKLAGDVGELIAGGHAAPEQEALARMRRRIRKDMETGAARIQLAEERAERDLAQVIGYEALKRDLREVARGACEPAPPDLAALGIGTPNGILLHGPPGNGKTFLIESLAAELGLDFLLISGEQLASGGGLDGVIRELGKLADNAIRMAVTHRGILVFFDEFDAVAPQRMDSKYRSAVLGTVGRLRGTPKLVLAAATNFYQRLDAATIRAGRFDCHVELSFPDAATLAGLIRAFLRHEWLAPRIEDAALAALAGRWAEQRVSVSECRAAVHGAIRAAVRDRGPRPYVLELADLRLPARQTPPQSEEAVGMADWG